METERVIATGIPLVLDVTVAESDSKDGDASGGVRPVFQKTRQRGGGSNMRKGFTGLALSLSLLASGSEAQVFIDTQGQRVTGVVPGGGPRELAWRARHRNAEDLLLYTTVDAALDTAYQTRRA